MSQTRTHTEEWNEYIAYMLSQTKAWEMAHILLCRELQITLNNQGLIDRKRMLCHFAGAAVINTFFHFVRAPSHYCFVGPDPSPVQ